MQQASVNHNAKITAPLLHWYDQHARDLPWRFRGGVKANPYHVWLSEVMLQQTTVAAVIPYFREFLTRWPSVNALAAAADEDVMAAWAGLGYYARARNLLACARYISSHYNGHFPQTESELQTLPGIGPYTAAAIAAIAFNQVAAPVDGNIERVFARLFSLETPLPKLKTQVRSLVQDLVPQTRPGDFAQALMDLGATICTPKSPDCQKCPIAKACDGKHIAHSLPRRPAKASKPKRTGSAFWLYCPQGRVLMRQRPSKGLLGGMLEFPSHGWDKNNNTARRDLGAIKWQKLPGEVKHVFTHFELTLKVEIGHASSELLPDLAKRSDLVWISEDEMHRAALPSLMRKIAVHVAACLQR